ncbi:MAG: SdrD B-like domain-containing protein [Thermoguttaceae bacterium]
MRICRFEQIEARQMLSATVAPLHVAATYFEDSNNFDEPNVLQGTNTAVADLFEVSFTGGADGTELTEIRIDTNNTFFNTASGGGGSYSSFPLTILSHEGFDVVSSSVSNGGTELVFTLSGFTAGEKLVFSIDVDENGNLQANAVAEGAEFEGATLTASFTAPHMEDLTTDALIFYDYYDLTGTGLENVLPNDDYDNTAADAYVPEVCSTGPVYTAGVSGSTEQTALPITLSGTVFEDLDADNHQDADDLGIGGVELTLYELGDDGSYVSTGNTTTTDDDGNYTFEGLTPGTYRVVETQPDEYLSVGDTPGTVDGETRGVVTTVDILSDIELLGGDDSVHNDFAETLPASISGFVYVDANNNGVFDDGETPLGGATLTLLDADGNSTGNTTTTDESGYYLFDNLTPGVYGVAEVTPDGYQDGLDAAGTAGGTAHNPGDLIDGVTLISSQHGKNYDFGELLPASISGHVYVDVNGNESLDSSDTRLANVTVYLLNSDGDRIDSTTTDENGEYSFTGLTPGVYSVEEVQPSGYLEGGNAVGTAGGSLDGYDRILSAQLDAGVQGEDYDFYEIIPAKISGYVFQDGSAIVLKESDPDPDIASLRDGKLTSDDTRLSGITLTLCDATGYPLTDSNGNEITTTTDANGYYEFTGLRPGEYSIVESQPENYVPGIDTAGSNGGLVVNRYATVDESILSTLAVSSSGSAIVHITIASGDTAVQYNFSEVLIQRTPDDPSGPTPPTYPTPYSPAPSPSPYAASPLIMTASYVVPISISQPSIAGGGGPAEYTWHLSVIDAGQPRSEASGALLTESAANLYFDPVSWTGAEMDQCVWTLADENGVTIKTLHFGMVDASPVAGDWDGSGVTKIGVFLDGLWFLDLNGNGVWDEKDLWIKLGKKGDQAVTGDWNGDQKTDIGIYGPAWVGDSKAATADPGLPDAMNPPPYKRPKNVPPDPADAAVGWRTMKKGTSGRMRSDLIDHVFQYGQKGDIAVTGDWNGDGIYSIGIFRNGTWYLDIDGDGRWGDADVMVEYGQQGDIPIVGDWTGDGISKIGVYRHGTFHLDTNNNRKIDASDKVFALGGAGDKPIVGDWTGNGVDKVGVCHGAAHTETPLQASRR